MGKSQESWNKREKEKKKAKKKEEKMKKKAERQEAGGSSSFDDMIAYVDENGNIVDTPPDVTKKEEINAEDIIIGIPPKEEMEDPGEQRGTVTFFNEDKGYGFIKVNGSNDSLFTHVNSHIDPIKEGNLVTYEVVPGDKGPQAVNVKVVK